MIKQFKFRNVFSFREETIINFEKKDGLKDSNKYVFDDSKNNLLKFIITYGKNNVGKTNLLRAIQSFYSFMEGNSSMSFKPLSSIYNNWSFFGVKNEPIEYEIIFTNKINDKIHQYRYGFSFNEQEVLTEFLYLSIDGGMELKVFDKNIENKNEVEKIFSKTNFKSSPGLFVNLPKNKLLLPIAANVGEFNSTWVLTSLIRKNININFDVNNHLYDVPLGKLSEEQVSDITKFINNIDISIDEIKFKEQIVSNVHQNESKKIRVPYFKINETEVPLTLVSLGTKKIINYLSLIINLINTQINKKNEALTHGENVNNENFIIMIDEFDAGIHPRILENLVNQILDKIKELNFEMNIQLFLTSHNPLLLGDKDLRRDQIIFVEKNKEQSSYIVELGNQSIRKDVKLAKAFMEGKLGGVPNINVDKIIKDGVKDILRESKEPIKEIIEELIKK